MTDTDTTTAEVVATTACPSCMAPTGTPCTGSYGIHADRIDHHRLQTQLEHGTCALCGQPMVRGVRVPGGPVTAWHPAPEDQACPDLPDAETDWNAYAVAINLGLAPGVPDPSAFIPADLLAAAETLVDSGAAPNLQAAAAALQAALDAPVEQPPVWPPDPTSWPCPECVAGKHGNCVGQGLHPVTDQLGPCACQQADHEDEE